MYRALNEQSHEMKFAGEWLKSHHTQRLRYNATVGKETWILEIWGEWAGIVEKMPVHWLLDLRRFDVRATLWDTDEDTIINLGQHLQRTITSHNIHVYSTKPATKRQGRDRGGKGFAIGSHKSDLRVSCYKRTSEPCGQEFQCSGAMLRRLALQAYDWYMKTGETIDPWRNLRARIEKNGNRRLMSILERAEVGTYWPVIGADDIPRLPPIQAAFLVEAQDILDDDDLMGRHPDEQG